MQDGTLSNERIEQLMLELAKQLKNTSGKKQYGYLKPSVKSLVDEIVNELERDERVAAAYNLWYEMREEVLRTYKDDLPKRIPLSRQKEFTRRMVIRFVTMRNFLLPELSQQFSVGVVYRTGGRLLLLKNAAHVVQEPGHGIEQQGRRMFVIPLPCCRIRSSWRSMILRQLSAEPHRLLDHNIFDPLELLLPHSASANARKLYHAMYVSAAEKSSTKTASADGGMRHILLIPNGLQKSKQRSKPNRLQRNNGGITRACGLAIVNAPSWEQATIEAAQWWDVPWKEVAALCECEREEVVPRHVCIFLLPEFSQ